MPVGPAAIEHPVLSVRLDDSLLHRPVWEMDLDAAKREAETVVSVPAHTLDAWNPPFACFQTVGCPNCNLAARRRSFNFTWSPGNADITTCNYCNHAYPSKDYPLNHTTKVTTPLGAVREYPYYLGKDGWRYYMDSQMYNLRRFWLRQQALLLAHLYRETGDPGYAQVAGRIIRRFAEIYPEIPLHGPAAMGDPNPTFYDEFKILPPPPDGVHPIPDVFGLEAYRAYDTPYPKHCIRAGLWNRWTYDEVPLSLILAYDQIADTLDPSDRGLIEDYFRQTVNFVRTFPRHLGNFDPLKAKWEIVCGRVIGEPEFVHGGILRIQLMARHVFYPDGCWCEGALSYGAAVLHHLTGALSSADGYSDPPGFTGREDGAHYSNVSLDTLADLPRLRRALEGMLDPNGDFVPVFDTTWPTQYKAGVPKFLHPPLGASKPALLWACGHASLGAGEGESQVQARLQFMGSGVYSHSHLDRLSLQLFAGGKELLSDIGYSQNNMRSYATSALAHNLVLVDEKSQACYNQFHPGGQVLAFGVDHSVVQLVSVRAPQAYPELKEYCRSVALVVLPDDNAYVVDRFDVHGGSQHDWLLHGDADSDSALVSEFATQPAQGAPFRSAKPFEMWTSENGGLGARHPDNLPNAFGLVRNVRSARRDHGWAATFQPAQGAALRLHMVGAEGTDVFFGELPSIRRAEGRNDALLDYWMPLVIVRRTGQALRSAFLAVHEPYRTDPFIDSVEGTAGTLVVKAGDFTDIHLFGPVDGAYHQEGRYGFLRIRGDTVETAYLADGTRLAWNGGEIDLPHPDTGTVLEARATSLRLSDAVSIRSADRIHLTFPDGLCYAVPIAGAGPDGKTLELREDPGFQVQNGSGEYTAFPGGPIDGPVKYRIPRYGGF